MRLFLARVFFVFEGGPTAKSLFRRDQSSPSARAGAEGVVVAEDDVAAVEQDVVAKAEVTLVSSQRRVSSSQFSASDPASRHRANRQ